MLLHVASLGERPAEGSAEVLSVSEAEPLVLSLELLDDERLHAASLILRRANPPGPGPVRGVSSTSAGGSLAGVEWVTASWSQARSVESLSLSFASKPSPLVVRLSIARGASGWHSPPGPHTFTLGATMGLHATLPDTVAERVLVEFLDPQGAAVAVSLSESNPLTVQLGREPRDLELRVRGRRPMLRWAGGIPEGTGLVIDDLRTRVDAELGTARASSVVLELRAAVAGEVALDWSFASLRIGKQFPDGSPTRTTSLSWGGEVDESLLVAEADPVRLETLALSIAASPVSEQLVLAPAEGTTGGSGQLVRPLYEAAQALPLRQAWSLTGIDVLGRTLADGTSITVTLHPDATGRPAAGAAVELHGVIEASMRENAWLSFDLAAPLPLAPGWWWLAIRVDDGELVWSTTSSPGSGGLLHRRDRGQWLSRDGRAALVRVRAMGDAPAHPLRLWLRGVEAGPTSTPWELPLTLDDDGEVRWSTAADAPSPSSRISLRIVTDVATSVVLSNLELRYRPSAP